MYSTRYGALGHGYSGKQLPDILRPKYIDALSGIRCVAVAAGELHSAAVTVDGDLYCWGDGFVGQLGMGDKRPRLIPEQVKGELEDECISNVSLGARHSLVVTEDGEVFSFGLGRFGVLGRLYSPYDHEPTGTRGGIDDNNLDPALNFAAHQSLEDESNNFVNDQIETNGNERQDAFERLFNLMSNTELEDSSNQCVPTRIDALEGIKVVACSAGHRHSLFLDDEGNLYSCGDGTEGCLGHGDYQFQMIPTMIKALSDSNIKVAQMSAGVDMSMAVTNCGNVYSFGKNNRGSLGLGIESSRFNVPTEVHVETKEKSMKAVDVECGYVHSVIIGLSGTIYRCGSVGINGAADGGECSGEAEQEIDFNIWHRNEEPKELAVSSTKERWKKFGKYEIKGRQKMMNAD